MSSSLVVELTDAKFSWGRKSKPAQSAIIDIPKLQVKKQQHLFIKGPSGSGKTTLLNLLTGINVLDSGDLQVLGQSMAKLSSAARDKFRADHLGVIFQQFNLLPYLSVLDNVLLPCQFSALRKRQSQDALAEATQLLIDLRIPKKHHQDNVMSLSVGQQQRVSVARALMGMPELIIADEPTSALDSDARDNFMEMLFTQAESHQSTIIFVSHDNHLSKYFSHQFELQAKQGDYSC